MSEKTLEEDMIGGKETMETFVFQIEGCEHAEQPSGHAFYYLKWILKILLCNLLKNEHQEMHFAANLYKNMNLL